MSGLLFKEFKRYGDIKPFNFLIRRGFKIYPIYYLFYLPYLIPILLNGNLNIKGLVSDMFFLQNYTFGWGYSYAASWLLAVEEHFYFVLAVALWFLFKKIKSGSIQSSLQTGIIEKIIVSIMMACIAVRIISNIVFADQIIRNFSMTDLRIDSLLAGVLVSYWYHFKFDTIKSIFNNYKKYLLSIFFDYWHLPRLYNPCPLSS